MYASSDGGSWPRGLGDIAVPANAPTVQAHAAVDPDETAATARLYSLPVQYNLPGIGRVVDGGGYWYGLDARGPGMGSSISPDFMAAHGLPPQPGAVAPFVRTSLVEIAVGQATDPNSPGWNALVNQGVWPAFVAELEAEHTAGVISDAGYQHALTLEDSPQKMEKDHIYLPPGVTDVPVIFQGYGVTETGAIHPDAASAAQQKAVRDILAYSAQKKGTTYQQEAANVTDKLRASDPSGELAPGVEKLAQGIDSGTIVPLSQAEVFGKGWDDSMAPSVAGAAVPTTSLSSGTMWALAAVAGLVLLVPEKKKGR